MVCLLAVMPPGFWWSMEFFLGVALLVIIFLICTTWFLWEMWGEESRRADRAEDDFDSQLRKWQASSLIWEHLCTYYASRLPAQLRTTAALSDESNLALEKLTKHLENRPEKRRRKALAWLCAEHPEVHEELIDRLIGRRLAQGDVV